MNATAVPAGRTLHLVDLENVLGDPWATGPDVAGAYEATLRAGRHQRGDLVVVAANRWLLAELGLVPHTSCQLLVASGPDGADRALLGWAEPGWIVARFDRLVVASGDGIFAELVRVVGACGRRVDVVRGRGGVAKQLGGAAVRVARVRVPAKARVHHRRVARVRGRRS
jgi:hypothetical protein